PNWDATQGNPAQAVGGHTELLVSNPALAATTGGASYRLTGGPQAGIVSNPHTTHLWPLDFSGADLVGDRPMVLDRLDLDRAGPGGHDGWRSNTFNHDSDRGVVEDFSGFGSAAGGIEFWMRSNPNFGNRTIVSYAAGSANAF